MTNSKVKSLTDLLPIPGQGASIVFSLSDLSGFSTIYAIFARHAADLNKNIVHVRFVPDDDSSKTGRQAAGSALASDSSGNAPASSSSGNALASASSGNALASVSSGNALASVSSGNALASSSAEMTPVREIQVRLNHRFRHFTVDLHEQIRLQEKGTIFVFDCLSDLQTAWATDLMMVNFFTVTTPLIRERGDAALFPLKALMHSDTASKSIVKLSDCFIDVCSDFKNIYLRAEKIRDESDQKLFQPHILNPDNGRAELITDGVKLSRFHRAKDMAGRIHADLSMDSWDRFFMSAQRKYEYGEDLADECFQMCRIMMSRDLRMRKLILENFQPADYFFVKEHMVGSGQIGGKSCGMLTARKLIENQSPELYDYMEAHDSFYIGSDVYTSYIVENGLWNLSVEQHTKEGYFSLSSQLREAILKGSFWPQIEQQFEHLLDYYGQEPIIVRSSSILEDGFDNAFAGKYDSVFVPNVGTREERLQAFENAVRTVYASTMSLSALDYRKRRGLSSRDEEMAILVMRVSGSHFGNYFMPCAAGVGYSYSPYRFLQTLNPEAGMLRLVMGLGTSAVDRIEGAYPRLVSLDQPDASPYHTSADRHRYSQQKVSLIDTTTASFCYKSLSDIYSELPVWLRRILLEHDTQAERTFRDRGIQRNIEFISCRGLTKNTELMELLRSMLRQLHNSYGQSVDIEFTINLSEDGDYVVNLLQCRPLLVMSDDGISGNDSGGKVGLHGFIESDSSMNADRSQGSAAEDISDIEGSGQSEDCNRTASTVRILLETRTSSMGMSRSADVDGIVYIDPVAYYEMPYNDKPQIARSLGQLNWQFREEGKALILLTPGRIGTSSPELGVPTTFSDISSFSVICEIAESKAGYQPELSYGSHIFQDLVEADILYDAVFEDERRVHFHPELLRDIPNTIRDYVPDADEQIIGFYDLTGRKARVIHDMKTQRLQIQVACPGTIGTRPRV